MRHVLQVCLRQLSQPIGKPVIDYSKPQYETRKVAEACGIKPAHLRTYFSRGQFRIIGLQGEKGMANLFSLRDAMTYAVACRLIDLGADPHLAFNLAALNFAHVGNEERNLCGMFDFRERGETLFAYWPDSGKAEVIASDDIESVFNLRLTHERGEEAVVVIRLNPIERRVFEALGVDQPK